MERTRRYYEAQGFDKPYVWAHFDDVPFAPLPQPLEQCRLALVTTSALYDREATDPRYVDSGSMREPPERLFANDLAWDKNATHMEDRRSYFPVERIHELAAMGVIGRVASRFHCAPTEYSIRRTLTKDAPELLARCRQDNADIALLVPL